MKKTKIVIPALGMLLLSTAASITGTVAWFSMNNAVTANGLQISAKSDNTYLLISKTNTTASAIQSENAKTVDLSSDNAILYACAPCLSSEEAAYLTTSGKIVSTEATITVAGEIITNGTKAAAATNWYTATAAAPGAATMEEGSARQLSTLTNYVLVEDLYLTVAAGANKAHNLTVTSTIAQVTGGNDVAAVKFLIATDDGAFRAVTTANNGTPLDISGTNTDITDTSVRHVSVYVYYDGNESHVYTNNVVNMKGATINLAFNVEANNA